MEKCLEKSVEQYRKIVAHANQLEKLLKNADPEVLRQYTQKLHELQDEAIQRDRVFNELFLSHKDTYRNHPLFQERSELIEQIVKMNHLLLPRIRGMMAVAAHEISQIKGGRVAMAGYHQPSLQKRKGTRIVG